MSQLPPLPVNSPVLNGRFISSDYYQWLFLLQNQTQKGRQLVGSKALTNQAASIVTAPLALPSLATGYYSLSYYARITTPDPVSSSLSVTLGWTESAISLSLNGAPINGNTTATVQSGSVIVLVDGGSPITYATAYSSNTAGAMHYRLSVLVESLST